MWKSATFVENPWEITKAEFQYVTLGDAWNRLKVFLESHGSWDFALNAPISCRNGPASMSHFISPGPNASPNPGNSVHLKMRPRSRSRTNCVGCDLGTTSKQLAICDKRWRVGINLIIFGDERKCDRLILTHWCGAPARGAVFPAQGSFTDPMMDEYPR